MADGFGMRDLGRSWNREVDADSCTISGHYRPIDQREVKRGAIIASMKLPSARPRLQRSFDTTLVGLVDALMQAVDAEAGAVYLIDEEQGDLEMVYGYASSAVGIGHRLARGEGLIGLVVELGRSVVSSDVSVDPRAIRQRADWSSEPFVHSFLGLPLWTGNELIGAIELSSSKVDAFIPDDRARGMIMADAFALLIEQSRLTAQPPPAAIEGASLSDESPMGMLTLNSRLQVTSANPTFCRMTSQNVESLVGRPALLALPALGRPRARDAMEAALRGAPGHLGLARVAGAEGSEQSLSISMIPLGDPARVWSVWS